jgi:hypothetical protein
MFDLRRLLDAARGHPEGMARVRLGRGVVGNTTYASIAFFGAFVAVVVALRNTPIFAIAAVCVLLVAYVIYLLGTYLFADKHPDRAMLGDSEWLQFQQMHYAALGVANVPASRAGPDPKISTIESENGGPDGA